MVTRSICIRSATRMKSSGRVTRRIGAPTPRGPEAIVKGASASIEDREVFAPGTDRFAVALRHHAGHLRQVSEVVGDPGREVLAKRDGAEGGVEPGPGEVRRGEAEGGEAVEIRGAELGEGVE